MKILVTPTSIKPGDPRLKKLEDFADELVFNPLGKPLGEEDLPTRTRSRGTTT